MTKKISSLLQGSNQRIAKVERKITEQGNYLRLYIEDMENSHVLGITVEIPEEVAGEYDLEGMEIE